MLGGLGWRCSQWYCREADEVDDVPDHLRRSVIESEEVRLEVDCAAIYTIPEVTPVSAPGRSIRSHPHDVYAADRERNHPVMIRPMRL